MLSPTTSFLLIPLLSLLQPTLSAPLPLPAILRRVDGLGLDSLGSTLQGVTALGGGNNDLLSSTPASGLLAPVSGTGGSTPASGLLGSTPASGLLGGGSGLLGGGNGGLLGGLGSGPGDLLDSTPLGGIVGTLDVSLGVALDILVPTTLTCGNVHGWFGGEEYDMGCTCYGTDGGLLLEVDLEAVVNVLGLEAWVKAQVSWSFNAYLCLSWALDTALSHCLNEGGVNTRKGH
jgi:hypothetical protein